MQLLSMHRSYVAKGLYLELVSCSCVHVRTYFCRFGTYSSLLFFTPPTMSEVSRGCDLSVSCGEVLLLSEVAAGVRDAGASVKLLGFLEQLNPVVRSATLSLDGAAVVLNTELLAGVPLVEGQLYHVIGELEESESGEWTHQLKCHEPSRILRLALTALFFFNIGSVRLRGRVVCNAQVSCRHKWILIRFLHSVGIEQCSTFGTYVELLQHTYSTPLQMMLIYRDLMLTYGKRRSRFAVPSSARIASRRSSSIYYSFSFSSNAYL